MNEKMELIDEVRARINVSYEEAKEALEEADYDVLDAIILLENKKPKAENLKAKGSELLDKVKDLVKEGNVTRIKVKSKEKVILDLPMTVGAAGVLLAPQIALIGSVVALLSSCSIEVEKNGEIKTFGNESSEETSVDEE